MVCRQATNRDYTATAAPVIHLHLGLMYCRTCGMAGLTHRQLHLGGWSLSLALTPAPRHGGPATSAQPWHTNNARNTTWVPLDHSADSQCCMGCVRGLSLSDSARPIPCISTPQPGHAQLFTNSASLSTICTRVLGFCIFVMMHWASGKYPGIADIPLALHAHVPFSHWLQDVVGVAGVPSNSPTFLPATSTNLYMPWGIALDSHGNLYIAESGKLQPMLTKRECCPVHSAYELIQL
jgi:hypothetical protein